ncbi:hypothetical protein GCM10022268_11540 [Sphingomonas cynarae]|uniref:Uncharacterized protein n=1 Tax=Sphingomonas cynarae TaxID=930197 RepID=A0ABP7DFF8_9SPHN
MGESRFADTDDPDIRRLDQMNAGGAGNEARKPGGGHPSRGATSEDHDPDPIPFRQCLSPSQAVPCAIRMSQKQRRRNTYIKFRYFACDDFAVAVAVLDSRAMVPAGQNADQIFPARIGKRSRDED